MENRPVVEAVFALLAAHRMGPVTLALGQFDKVGYGFGRFFFKEAADDSSFGGIKDGIGAGLARHHEFPFL